MPRRAATPASQTIGARFQSACQPSDTGLVHRAHPSPGFASPWWSEETANACDMAKTPAYTPMILEPENVDKEARDGWRYDLRIPSRRYSSIPMYRPGVAVFAELKHQRPKVDADQRESDGDHQKPHVSMFTCAGGHGETCRDSRLRQKIVPMIADIFAADSGREQSRRNHEQRHEQYAHQVRGRPGRGHLQIVDEIVRVMRDLYAL